MEIVTLVAAFVGIVTGTAALILGVVNYLRDRAVVTVSMNWGMVRPGEKTKFVTVSVANLGRRPIFISHAHLLIPNQKGDERGVPLLSDSIAGQKLSEGDKPAIFMAEQEGLVDDPVEFKTIRAAVTDSAGEAYCSRLLSERGLIGWIRWKWATHNALKFHKNKKSSR